MTYKKTIYDYFDLREDDETVIYVCTNPSNIRLLINIWIDKIMRSTWYTRWYFIFYVNKIFYVLVLDHLF